LTLPAFVLDELQDVGQRKPGAALTTGEEVLIPFWGGWFRSGMAFPVLWDICRHGLGYGRRNAEREV